MLKICRYVLFEFLRYHLGEKEEALAEIGAVVDKHRIHSEATI